MFRYLYTRQKYTTHIILQCKGPCTLSPKSSYAFFPFFVFVILSHQNACYRCENAENRTWAEFFYDGWKFWRQCVNMIDTTWSYLFINVWKFRTRCAMTLTAQSCLYWEGQIAQCTAFTRRHHMITSIWKKKHSGRRLHIIRASVSFKWIISVCWMRSK